MPEKSAIHLPPGAGRVPDLGLLKKPDDKNGQREAQIGMELLSGMRCGGCFRRITQGVKIIRFTPKMGPRGPQMQKGQRAACLREDCSYAESSRSGAAAMELVEYAWICGDPDPDGKLTRALAAGGNGTPDPAPAASNGKRGGGKRGK